VSIRLNKLLAQRGIGARRKCDALIQSGSVRVNGAVVREPGTAVEPDRDRVEVNGRELPPLEPPAYFVLHKPVGVISTLSDPEGRRTLVEFLPPGRRVFPVGRLDADTSGLLMLTSDGELAHHLMHPRYGVTKLYRVHADRAPSPEMLRRLREGIEFEPGVRSAPARVRVRDTGPGESVIELEPPSLGLRAAAPRRARARAVARAVAGRGAKAAFRVGARASAPGGSRSDATALAAERRNAAEEIRAGR
jgi:16S rRNA U516 pseudouridylate synthase RsuA-like enzyme